MTWALVSVYVPSVKQPGPDLVCLMRDAQIQQRPKFDSSGQLLMHQTHPLSDVVSDVSSAGSSHHVHALRLSSIESARG